jgi:hypothetical protein
VGNEEGIGEEWQKIPFDALFAAGSADEHEMGLVIHLNLLGGIVTLMFPIL